jgi:hypothetical protein
VTMAPTSQERNVENFLTFDCVKSSACHNRHLRQSAFICGWSL